jgi:hypothetical protein
MRGLRKTLHQKSLKRGGNRGKVFDPIMVEEVDTDVFLNGTPDEPLDDNDRNDRVVVFLDDTRASGMGLFRSQLRNPSLDQIYGNTYRQNIVGDQNNSFLTLSIGDINATVSLRDCNLIINSPLRHFILTKTEETTEKLFSYTLIYAYFPRLHQRPEWIEYVRNNPEQAEQAVLSGAHGQEGTDREIYSVTPLTEYQYTRTVPQQDPVTPPVQREDSSEILARQLQEEEFNAESPQAVPVQNQEEVLEHRQRPRKISAKQSDYIRHRTQRQADLNRHLGEASRSKREEILKRRREFSPQQQGLLQPPVNPFTQPQQRWIAPPVNPFTQPQQKWPAPPVNPFTQPQQKWPAPPVNPFTQPQQGWPAPPVNPFTQLRNPFNSVFSSSQQQYQSAPPAPLFPSVSPIGQVVNAFNASRRGPIMTQSSRRAPFGGQIHSISSIRGHRLPSLPTRRVRHFSSSKKRRYSHRRRALQTGKVGYRPTKTGRKV